MAPELPSRLPFDVRLSRASTRAKIALVRAICRVFGVYGATRFLLATIDWARGDKRVSYFPDARPLDPKLVAALGKHCPLRVYDQRFAVVSFPMEKR
jgi:hypothetical protein